MRESDTHQSRLTAYAVVDRIINYLKLTFVAAKDLIPQSNSERYWG